MINKENCQLFTMEAGLNKTLVTLNFDIVVCLNMQLTGKKWRHMKQLSWKRQTWRQQTYLTMAGPGREREFLDQIGTDAFLQFTFPFWKYRYFIICVYCSLQVKVRFFHKTSLTVPTRTLACLYTNTSILASWAYELLGVTIWEHPHVLGSCYYSFTLQL